MEYLLKRVLYTGVGLVAGMTERLQHSIDDLVEKGKLSEEEGRKVVDDVVSNVEHQRPYWENKFKGMVDAAMERLNLPQSKALTDLEKRIKSLEVKVSLLGRELERQRKQTNGLQQPQES